MEATYKSIIRHLRIAPRKLRQITPLVKGMEIEEALDVLRYTPKKASRMVETALRSAHGNAKARSGGEVEALTIKSIRVDSGPQLRNAKRWIPKAMGRVGRIHPRTSHLEVVVAGELKEAPAGGEKKGRKKAAKTSAPVSRPAAKGARRGSKEAGKKAGATKGNKGKK